MFVLFYSLYPSSHVGFSADYELKHTVCFIYIGYGLFFFHPPKKIYILPLDCPVQVFLLSKLTCQADYHRKRLMAEAGCNNNRFV